MNDEYHVSAEYDDAFDQALRTPWLHLSETERAEATVGSRQGQLSAKAPEIEALGDSFSYQRGHADVFKEALVASNYHMPERRQRLRVVDVGSGAATVAVALAEHCSRNVLGRIAYVAFDSHPKMREIGRQMLDLLGSAFSSAQMVDSLREVEFAEHERALFTFSYVSHQSSVGADDITDWRDAILLALKQTGSAVQLLSTTAPI